MDKIINKDKLTDETPKESLPASDTSTIVTGSEKSVADINNKEPKEKLNPNSKVDKESESYMELIKPEEQETG
jgi:hypothetical protein